MSHGCENQITYLSQSSSLMLYYRYDPYISYIYVVPE